MRITTLSFLLSCILPAAGLGAALAAPLTITTEHSPPASMQGQDGVTGRETDKIREMMARTRTDYKIDLLPWKRAYVMALNQPQTCVYSTSRTPERERLFKWVGPADEAEWQCWGRIDHEFPLKTMEDARKLRIGTYNGDALGDDEHETFQHRRRASAGIAPSRHAARSTFHPHSWAISGRSHRPGLFPFCPGSVAVPRPGLPVAHASELQTWHREQRWHTRT